MSMVSIRKLRMAAERLERAEVAVAKATLVVSRLPDDASWHRVRRSEDRMDEALRERQRAREWLSSSWSRYAGGLS